MWELATAWTEYTWGRTLCVSTTQPRAGRIEGSSIGWARGRKVVVVGGGVAGLEAERGHKVVLFEAGSQLGGQVRLAQRAMWAMWQTGLSYR